MNREIALLEKLEKELNLKQLQIKSLLTITQAINDNVSAEGLFNMYKSFLSWEMGIEKMALFVIDDNGWHCTTAINFTMDHSVDYQPLLSRFKRMYTIKPGDHDAFSGFDIIIPVFHKEIPIAYAIIGGIKEKEDLYNKIQFITTITNIIAVAIENKRLFKKQIEQERYKGEMELASQVQQMLIPEHLPVEKNFALSKIYKPHYNIGGDYLDFIMFDADRFAFCIADISGMGVAAALLMANFQAMIQSLIFQYRDLETFVFALNQSVYRITRSDCYSFHAYPYYPDFVADDSTYQTYTDMLGNNSYVGYLTDLKGHYPRMPLIIAETGVPSSWGIAHYATNGMHHGGANQQLQGETMLRLFHNVKDTKCGGAIDFAWIDEWFKSTWITYPLDYDIDRRILWHNVMSPEQNYGLIGFTKPTVMENWASFAPNQPMSKITASADYDYFRINLSLGEQINNPDDIWIGLDTYRADLGESILKRFSFSLANQFPLQS